MCEIVYKCRRILPLRNLTARAAFKCPSGEENQTVKQKSLNITSKKKSLSAKVVHKPGPAKTPCVRVCVCKLGAHREACLPLWTICHCIFWELLSERCFGDLLLERCFVCLLSGSFFFPVSAGFVFDGLIILEVCRSQV